MAPCVSLRHTRTTIKMTKQKNQCDYSAPELVVYGDVRDITQNLGEVAPKADGAGGQINKIA